MRTVLSVNLIFSLRHALRRTGTGREKDKARTAGAGKRRRDCRHDLRPAGGGVGGRAGAHRGGHAAHAGFFRGRGLRASTGGGGDSVHAVEPERVFASFRQHVLRAGTRLQGGQRHLQESLGVVAKLDRVVGRSWAALQRARMPALPPEGWPRPAADARRARRDDVPAPLDTAANRSRTNGLARAPAGRHSGTHLRRPAPELLDPWRAGPKAR